MSLYETNISHRRVRLSWPTSRVVNHESSLKARIGRACARKLVLYDCDLALTYSTNRLAAEELVAQLKHDHETNVTSERYFRVSIHQGDLSKPEMCVKLYEEVRKAHGRPVDILVSNAGYGKRITDIWDISVEEFEYTLSINLTASFVLTKCVVDEMKTQHWGRIIYVSSIAAYGAGLNGCRESSSHHEPFFIFLPDQIMPPRKAV